MSMGREAFSKLVLMLVRTCFFLWRYPSFADSVRCSGAWFPGDARLCAVSTAGE